MAEFEKIQLQSGDDNFLKFSAKCTNFEISSCGLEVLTRP